MSKTAQTRFPIHSLMAERWSPRSFADRAVSREDLRSLFEAARWSASSYNEQPWSFIVGRKGDPTFEAIRSTLVPGNEAWASKAPVLILSVARTSFTRGEKPNRHAIHDTGMASLSLNLEAVARGLVTHMMAGFDPLRARAVLDVPDGFEPVAVTALGYLGDPEALEGRLRDAELAARTRKPLREIVFGERWGRPLAELEE